MEDIKEVALRCAEYGRIREEFELASKMGATFCIDSAMLNVDALCRSLLAELQKDAEQPVSYEYQDRDGNWKPFIDQRHYENTAKDGSWPIRALYTRPKPKAATVPEWTADQINDGLKLHRLAHDKPSQLADAFRAGVKYRERALSAAPSLPAAEEDARDGWRPIETAPTDGTVFLGYRDGKVREAHRVPRDDCEMWCFGGASGGVEYFPWLKPTHWKPIDYPAAPAMSLDSGKEDSRG